MIRRLKNQLFRTRPILGSLLLFLFTAGSIFGIFVGLYWISPNHGNFRQVSSRKLLIDNLDSAVFNYTGTVGGLVTDRPWGLCVNGSTNTIFSSFPYWGEIAGYYSDGSPCYYAG